MKKGSMKQIQLNICEFKMRKTCPGNNSLIM